MPCYAMRAINLDVWSCHLDFFQLRHIMMGEFIHTQVGKPGGLFALSNYPPVYSS